MLLEYLNHTVHFLFFGRCVLGITVNRTHALTAPNASITSRIGSGRGEEGGRRVVTGREKLATLRESHD